MTAETVAANGRHDRLLRVWAALAVLGGVISLVVSIVGVRLYFSREIQMQGETNLGVRRLVEDMIRRQEAAATEATARANQSEQQQKELLQKQKNAAGELAKQRDNQLLTFRLFSELRERTQRMEELCQRALKSR